jgi:hypothetical protein
LAIFYLGSTEHIRAFNFTGIAARMVVSVGMIQKPRHYISDSEAAHRQRLCWQIFLMDQTVSAVFGKPPIMSYENVGIDLPPNDDLSPLICFKDPDGLCTNLFREEAKLAIIGSNMYHKLYSRKPHQSTGNGLPRAIRLLDEELQTWHDELPFDIQPEQAPPANRPCQLRVLFLHFLYYKLKITIHWAVIRDVDPLPHAEELDVPRSMVLSAISARATICILDIVQRHYPHHPLAIVMLHGIFSSVVILFLNILQRTSNLGEISAGTELEETIVTAGKDLNLIRTVATFFNHDEVNPMTIRLLKATSGMCTIAEEAIKKATTTKPNEDLPRDTTSTRNSYEDLVSMLYSDIEARPTPAPDTSTSIVLTPPPGDKPPSSLALPTLPFDTPQHNQYQYHTQSLPLPMTMGMEWFMPPDTHQDTWNLDNPEIWNFNHDAAF